MIFSSVSVVLPDRIPEVWQYCKALVQAAIDTSPMGADIENVYRNLLGGKLELIVCSREGQEVSAALVIRYWKEGGGFVAHIQAAGGRGLSEAIEEWEGVRSWLRRKGVHRIQLYCQVAQERLWKRMGFSTAFRVMWMHLDDSEKKCES
jgi:hypothetical protein